MSQDLATMTNGVQAAGETLQTYESDICTALIGIACLQNHAPIALEAFKLWQTLVDTSTLPEKWQWQPNHFKATDCLLVLLAHLQLLADDQIHEATAIQLIKGSFHGLTSLEMSNDEALSNPPNLLTPACLPQLTHLHLKGYHHLPDFVLSCTQIRFLILKGCQLEQLPTGIGNLQQLEVFDASCNRLSSLPPDFVQLRQLRCLKLSSNALDEIEEGVGDLPALTEVELNFNFLLTLPKGFARQQVQLQGWANPYLQLDDALAEKLALDYQTNKDIEDHKGYTSRQRTAFGLFLYAFCGQHKLGLKGGDQVKIPDDYNLFEKLMVFEANLHPLSKKVDYVFIKSELIDRHIVGYVHGKVFEKIRHVFPDFECRLNAISRSDLYRLIDDSRLLSYAQNLPFNDTYILAYWKTPENIKNIKVDLENKVEEFLPDWLFRYSQVKELNLRDNQLVAVDEKLASFETLEGLDLSFNHLEHLPPGIPSLPHLRKLNLSNNELKTMIGLDQLTKLEILELNHNLLEILPSNGWGALVELKALYVNNNLLKLLPDNGWEALTKLETLDLKGNQLLYLPESIAQLPALKNLHLAHNCLRDIPAPLLEKGLVSIADFIHNYCEIPNQLKADCLDYLKELAAKEKKGQGQTSRLKTSPLLTQLFCLALFSTDADIRAACAQLLKQWLNDEEALLLEAWRYQTSVDYIALWQYLRRVNAMWRIPLHWRGIDVWVSRLTLKMTKRVLLSQQRLTCLPAFYFKHWRNTWVDLSHNHLRRLPQSLGHLQDIRRLDVSHNGLKLLQGGTFKQLSNVRNLNLSVNLLEEIPHTLFSELPHLANLDLGHNYIESLPYIAESSTKLKRLNLSLNSFSQVSSELVKLQGLQYLNLSYNQLGKNVSVQALPLEVSYMDKLTHLDLSYNFLDNLPPGIGLCERLEWLNLSQNNFEEFPVGLYDSLTLEMLDLSHNYLRQLPDDIAVIETLQQLILTGNPLPLEEVKRVKKLLPQTEVIFVQKVTIPSPTSPSKMYEPTKAALNLHLEAKVCVEGGQFERAIKYYKQAALSGDLASMDALGILYKKLQKNREASYWLLKAIDQGEMDAKKELAEVYRAMNELGKARYWYS